MAYGSYALGYRSFIANSSEILRVLVWDYEREEYYVIIYFDKILQKSSYSRRKPNYVQTTIEHPAMPVYGDKPAAHDGAGDKCHNQRKCDYDGKRRRN